MSVGGLVLGAKFYDDLKGRLMGWLNMGGADGGDRADMSFHTKEARTRHTKERLKRDIKSQKFLGKKGYARGFLHGTIGGGLLGGWSKALSNASTACGTGVQVS